MSTDQKSHVVSERAIAAPAVPPAAPAAVAPLQQHELSSVWLLDGVSLESVFGMLVHCSVVEHGAGHVLIAPTRSERTLFLLLRGSLEVHLEADLSVPVAKVEAGQSVGEISVIDARPASAYVVTAEPSRLLAIDEATFWRLIANSHPFSFNLLMLLAQRMRASNEQLSATAQRSRLHEREAITDALTGLYNRRWLDQRLPRLIARHLRAQRALSLLAIDIDHFKRFNDDFGHATGDRVLALVASTVLEQLRPTDLAVRYGGEEFFVVLPETALEGALVAAERLRARIEAARCHGIERAITVSIGVSQLVPPEDAPAIQARADQKLYLAKSRGRNRVES
jgi:diguanylate cyclase (GGDEF)-like protein